MASTQVGTSIGELAARKKKRQDAITIGGISLFLCILAFAAWYTDGRIVTSSLKFFASMEKPLESRNPAAACSNPKNKNTPYCQERKAATNANWSEMSKASGGKSSPYTLHNY